MLRQESITVLSGFKWPPIFADYYLMMILIGKEITEMNLDIDRVNNLIFSLNTFAAKHLKISITHCQACFKDS